MLEGGQFSLGIRDHTWKLGSLHERPHYTRLNYYSSYWKLQIPGEH